MLFAITVPSQDVELQWKLTVGRFEEWLQTDVFRLKWWFMLSLFLMIAYIWWKKVDKSKLNEIILYTAIITIIIISLDELGEELALWDYTTDLFPLFPPISAINLSCMPLTYSMIYQRFKTWKSFTIATILMSLSFCFIFEPLFVWIGVYQRLNWKSYYGFPIYTLMALLAKAIVNKLYKIAMKS